MGGRRPGADLASRRRRRGRPARCRGRPVARPGLPRRRTRPAGAVAAPARRLGPCRRAPERRPLPARRTRLGREHGGLERPFARHAGLPREPAAACLLRRHGRRAGRQPAVGARCRRLDRDRRRAAAARTWPALFGQRRRRAAFAHRRRLDRPGLAPAGALDARRPAGAPGAREPARWHRHRSARRRSGRAGIGCVGARHAGRVVRSGAGPCAGVGDGAPVAAGRAGDACRAAPGLEPAAAAGGPVVSRRPLRPLRRGLLGALLATAAGLAWGHGSRAGELLIDHPYATPTPAAASTGAVYFRAIANQGRSADRLLGASTPVAERVEIHRSTLDGDVMRMRALEALELPPGERLLLRHGGAGVHLMLLGLKAPLRDGGRFPLTLRFERAGSVEVMVWVQTPREGGAHQH
ncbi:hypothetical protein CLD22_12780 [Rubrivivax gelatinosus]|nr:hypothetical protein [Rubrivivax gelatinosus]